MSLTPTSPPDYIIDSNGLPNILNKKTGNHQHRRYNNQTLNSVWNKKNGGHSQRIPDENQTDDGVKCRTGLTTTTTNNRMRFAHTVFNSDSGVCGNGVSGRCRGGDSKALKSLRNEIIKMYGTTKSTTLRSNREYHPDNRETYSRSYDANIFGYDKPNQIILPPLPI